LSSEDTQKATAEFMLAEYQDLYQNVIHLENKLFNHLSFFTTLLVGIVTASIAIVQLVGETSGPLSRPIAVASVSLLFLLFFIVGRFELRMTTELRVRKMKFIEGITEIRRYFVDRDKVIEDYLVLPVGVEKAPPYLRVRCKDWYQILYISLMNGMAAFLFWVLPLWLVVRVVTEPVGSRVGLILTVIIVASWLAVGLLIFYLGFWWLSYNSALEFCERYDEMRADKMGEESQYDLLEPPIPDSALKRTFGDWIAWLTERSEGVGR
jgi:hypothetical protein